MNVSLSVAGKDNGSAFQRCNPHTLRNPEFDCSTLSCKVFAKKAGSRFVKVLGIYDKALRTPDKVSRQGLPTRHAAPRGE